jgi:hypothetical protein
MSWGIVEWIATSDKPPQSLHGLPEDWEVFARLTESGLDGNYILNRTVFSEYPYPELSDQYALWNDVHPFGRWISYTSIKIRLGVCGNRRILPRFGMVIVSKVKNQNILVKKE